MSEARRKRLIEVAFPLEEVSAHSRREKNADTAISRRCTSGGRVDRWRPAAPSYYASLVDDPETDAEREGC